MKLWLVVFACLVAYAGYYMTTIRLPEGISNPWRLRCTFSIMHFVFFFWEAGDKLGLWKKWECFPKGLVLSAGQPAGNLQVQDTTFDGVKVRLYIPPGQKTRPAIVFYHGGGWTVGSVETVDTFARTLSSETDTVIASVDYRLSPKYPYPVPLDDCETATKYLLENVKKYNVDAKRVAVMGNSAGGNIAAALSLKFRGKYALKLQILVYPVLQGIDVLMPSYQAGGDPFLTPRLMCEFFLNYVLGDKWTEADLNDFLKNNHTSQNIKRKLHTTYLSHDSLPKDLLPAGYRKNKDDYGNDKLWKQMEKVMLDPYFAPLLASDLSGLPEAHIITMGMDVLRDDGFLYAKRLKEANVEVSHAHVENGIHGLFSHAHLDTTKEAISNLIEYIKENLSQ